MNRFESQADDDLRFDLLVDGELDEAERQQLLASLDEEPGGWRRCALAFLEAQAWRQSMQDVQRSGVVPRSEKNGVAADPSRDRITAISATDVQDDAPGSAKLPLGGYAGLALAMAVCFLVAFFLGSEFQQRSRFAPGFSSGPSANRPAERVVQQQPPPGDGIPALAQPPDVAVASRPSEVIPWAEATFVMDDNTGPEVDVPVFDLDPYARQVLLENSSAVFDNLRRELERKGFDVQRRVRWSPVEMGGGQQMVVPVGDFEISLASHRAVQ